MEEYGPETYGERIAGVYDAWYPEAEPAAIELLAELAAGGRVLELGIGTGRLALPLAARGVEVYGVDASEAMMRLLREKPGGASIPVVLGDFAEVPANGPFSLVFVAFNTLFALLTQEDQVRCFRNVAARLAPDGLFALEAFVPDVARFDRGQRVHANRVESELAMLDLSTHDPVGQRVNSQHVVFEEGRVAIYPVQIRYAWPSELDLMARLAGLERRHRWGGWAREPFHAGSQRHVSVYGRQRPDAT